MKLLPSNMRINYTSDRTIIPIIEINTQRDKHNPLSHDKQIYKRKNNRNLRFANERPLNTGKNRQ